MKQRSFRLDNLRAFLILLVIFGHCLELINGIPLLYRVIYSFHMPAFIFLSGYLARPGKHRIASMLSVYVVFQLLYLLFDAVVLHGSFTFSIYFNKPYWLLWYQFTLLCYMLITPLFDRLSKKSPLPLAGVFVLSIALSLLCGYSSQIGYNLSLSRTLCFLPFYIAGYFCSHHLAPSFWTKPCRTLYRLVHILSFLFVLFTILYLNRYKSITSRMFYGSYAYASLGYDAGIRLRLHLIAAGWIIFLLLSLPDRPIPLFTALGRNTYPLFLFHGFVICTLQKYKFFHYSIPVNLFLALLVTLVLALLLGNSYVSSYFNAIMVKPFFPKKQS